MTPTARTLKFLREQGWHACSVEQWIPRIMIRRDAFNYGDILCCHPEKGIALVQVTTGANVSARLAKAKGNAALVAWLTAKGRILVHGWRRLHPRGERMRWEVREVELSMKDIVGVDGE